MRRVVDSQGLEPQTSALSGRRSNQLSYESLRDSESQYRERDSNPRPLRRRQVLSPLSYRGLVPFRYTDMAWSRTESNRLLLGFNRALEPGQLRDRWSW